MSAEKNGKTRKPRAQPKTRTARRGAITYRESAQAAHIPRKSYAALTQIVVPRVFLRSCRLPPAAFRVLCHGLTYPNGWNVRKCTVDTGFTARGVRASLSRLMAMGYVVRGSNPRDRRRAAYRFLRQPELTFFCPHKHTVQLHLLQLEQHRRAFPALYLQHPQERVHGKGTLLLIQSADDFLFSRAL